MKVQSRFIEMFKDVRESKSLCAICRPKQWPTIPTKDFTDDGYLVYGANGIIGHYSQYNHEHSTILMACRGASCGAINISQPKSYITGNAMCMDDIDDNVLFDFLAYFLSNYDYKTIITGGAQPQITVTNLQKVMVPIAPKSQQEAFGVIVKQADKSKFVGFKSQFIEMFGDQDTNDKQWTESLVKDEFKLSMGKTPARSNPECWENGTHRWISISDMATYTRYTGDTSEYITDYAITDSGIKVVPKGTIIMSFKLSIGRTAITSEDIYTNEAIMAFADFDEKKFNIDFLHFLIANKNWLLGAKQAVKGQTLNKESIGNAKIIIPPIEIQEEFASIYNQADKSKYYN